MSFDRNGYLKLNLGLDDFRTLIKMVVNCNVLFILLCGSFMCGSSCATNHRDSDHIHEKSHSFTDSQSTIRVLAINNPPFIDSNISSGIDMMILQTITKKLNLTIKLEYALHVAPIESLRYLLKSKKLTPTNTSVENI